LTFLALQLGQQLIRAGLFEPLLLVRSDDGSLAKPMVPTNLVSTAWGAGVFVALVAFALLVVLTELPLVVALLLLGFPFALAQDSLRYSSLYQDRGFAAMCSDVVWLVTQVLVLVLLSVSIDSEGSAAIAWVAGVATGLISVFWMHQQRLEGLRLGLHHVRTHRRAGGFFFVEQVIEGASGFAATASVGAVGGAAEAGRLQGARLIYGPVTMLQSSMPGLLLPAAVRRKSSRSSEVPLLVLGASLTALVPLGLWLAMLTPLGAVVRDLLGATGPFIQDLLLPIALSNAAGSLRLGLRLYLRVNDRLKQAMALRIVNAVLTLACGTGGAAINGAMGAAWGLVIAGLLGLVPWLVIGILKKKGRQA